MSNTITVVGTIATDPKRHTTSSGVVLCSFRLASGDRRYDREQNRWVDGETNWFGITAFRSLAENAVASFRKGERIIVTGKLKVRRWATPEKSGLSVEIEVEGIGHDLRWGVSRFEKHSRVEAAEAGEALTHQPQEAAEQSEQEAWLPAQEDDSGFDDSGFENGGLENSGAGQPQSDGFLPIAA